MTILIGILKTNTIINVVRTFCSNPSNIMKFLNVAEKNDAAKNIAGFLSRGTARRREGLSRYNKIYEFEANVLNQNTKMVMTSVSGHLLNYEFASNYRNWTSCNPLALFDAPVMKSCTKDYEPIKKTLEREIQSCNGLIIWTDCDREGENIGFEIIKVCREKKPNINVYRAKFSEITAVSVLRALKNLIEPNKNVSDAVDVRQEMDLRTGAAFTRLQTLHLSKVFPGKLSEKLISYGSCQFPTLGFVVDRFKDIETFVAEPFWKIKMSHTKKELTVDFTWDRDRLFVENPVKSILEICQEDPTAKVIQVINKPKNKWRPVPLDTIEMEKTVSRKLKINAKETMRIAERLYTQGFISYPRTETNIFPKELNLRNLVEQQTGDQRWGEFATRILNDGGPTPRQGKKSDQAHPPIHPTKYAPNLAGNEQRLYEYIVRHFLACCSKDAVGHETVIKVDIADEKFTTKGLIILERNYLDVYIYEKWNAKEVHNYQEGETFQPSVLEMAEGSTSAPKLLTEADLISLMEKNGIGTDATHADHIDTIKSREYVGLHENVYFIPGTLGMGLVEGYDSIGLDVSLAKPVLRSDFEKDLKLICDGQKDPKVVLREQIIKYRAMFQNVVERMNQLEEKLSHRIEEQRIAIQGGNMNTLPTDNFNPVLKCPKCDFDMIVRKRKNDAGVFIACTGFPQCRNAIWLPAFVENVEILNDTCDNCGPNVKKLKVKFRHGQNPFFAENPKILCVGGCDMNVLETLNIALSSVVKTNLPGPEPNIPQSRNTTNNTNNEWIRPNNNTTRPTNTQRTNNRTTQNNSNTSGGRNNPDSGYNSWIQPNQALVSQNKTTRAGNSNTTPINQNEVLCNCGNQALLLTVKKEGPNKGRLFYKCSLGKDGGGCDYFLWAPDDQTIQQSNQSFMPPPSTSTSTSASAEVVCNCGNAAVLRTVQKEGPNQGRKFYVCTEPAHSKCNFFKWESDVDNNDGGGGGYNQSFGGSNNSSFHGGSSSRSRGRGRGGGGVKRKAPTRSNQGGKSRRKCGICGEEGHIRTNCPNSG